MPGKVTTEGTAMFLSELARRARMEDGSVAKICESLISLQEARMLYDARRTLRMMTGFESNTEKRKHSLQECHDLIDSYLNEVMDGDTPKEDATVIIDREGFELLRRAADYVLEFSILKKIEAGRPSGSAANRGGYRSKSR